ncbi:MAG: TIGR04086 family membrane protein [Schaedlerella sp.]|nr:TIGR04086 family membrane protein [Schaedlerella sp.]
MNKENKGRQEIGLWSGWILKSLLCAYIVTGIFLLLLALLLYKMNLNESKVTIGIILGYVISTFAGGFAAGKMAKARKFLWGLITGITYFIVLFIVSFVLYRELQGNGINVMTTFLLCAGGGMLGGMIS